jgi:carbamoyltransferase
MKKILGISAYYHDSAAALIKNGKIIAAAQEERFSRKKHDAKFPANAIAYCLSEANAQISDIDAVVFYDKPILKFERILETYLAYAPRGIVSFLHSMPIWLKEKLYLKSLLKKELSKLKNTRIANLPPIFFAEHHQSHAASAFFPSPFETAAVFCLDGVGEWATTSVWLGEKNKLIPQWEIHFPHSLGLLYSAFTYYTGFKVNSGEYKLMGLAPYGEPKYKDVILDNLIDVKSDGTFRLNMDYFNYAIGLTMTNERFHKLLGSPPRKPDAELNQYYMDIASSIQEVTEEIVLKLVATIKKELSVDYLCLAGGLALNCVANGQILRESKFKDIWIQPAAGDAGGAIGAALSLWYEYGNNQRTIKSLEDSMEGSYLGPHYTKKQIQSYLDSVNASYTEIEDEQLFSKLAEILAQGCVVGWFQGRMEFGPRALGNRSIIGDPRNPKMQSVMNLKIKYRESFRPFAPSIIAEKVQDYFDIDRPSPYMLLVAAIKEEHQIAMDEEQKYLFGIDKLNIPRSSIPAVTHVDYSARIQTVHKETNPRYYKLLQHFETVTGCPLLVNTSFNVRGEPIVCTPEDAYRCFLRTDMDYLVIENFFLAKELQISKEQGNSWMTEFELD